MCYGVWTSNEFHVYDLEEFEQWICQWPEVTWTRAGRENAVLIGADMDWCYEYCGEPPHDFPVLKVFAIDHDGEAQIEHVAYLDQAYEDNPEMYFLEELGARIAHDSTCVLTMIHDDWFDVKALSAVLNGGDDDFTDRFCWVSLDVVATQAATRLAGGRRLIGMMAAE